MRGSQPLFSGETALVKDPREHLLSDQRCRSVTLEAFKGLSEPNLVQRLHFLCYGNETDKVQQR